MKKIRNMNVPGECTNGYAGPVENGRGGSRKSPVNFTGASPPSNRFSFIRKKITAAFFILTALIFSFFPRTDQSNTLGDGKFTFNDIVYAMALPFSVFTSCKPEPEPEPMGPTQHTVMVTLASVSLPSTSLDLTPNYSGTSGLTGTFTSTLTETNETTGVVTNYFTIDGNTISIPAGFTGSPWPPPPRVTQTFYYNGEVIGSLHFNLRAQSMGGGVYNFTQIYSWTATPPGGPFTSFPAAWNLSFVITE